MELGLFTVKAKKIKINHLSDKFNLFFFSDIHFGNPSCDVERLDWFLTKCKKEDQSKCIYMGIGDYFDFTGISEVKKIQEKNFRQATLDKLEESLESDSRKLAGKLSFMKGNLLGLLDGNHIYKYSNGKTSTEDMAERLDTEPLGWLCYYKLQFEVRPTSWMTVDIVACHGKAGGKTVGVTLNQVDDLRKIFPMADIYVMGHDHQRGAWPESVLYVPQNTTPKIKQKRQFLCRSGAFKKAYEPGQIGYEVFRVLKPSDLGGLRLEIGFHRNRKDGSDELTLDIHAEI